MSIDISEWKNNLVRSAPIWKDRILGKFKFHLVEK
jgi:hypothetical protein